MPNQGIILDFFSGSATTAHAVMQLNAEDGGSRKFIQVQLPEQTDEKSEAFKAGYKNICEIGKERIRRAGAKIKEETGAEIDYGFRVFRLDSSNRNEIQQTPQATEQATLDLFVENFKPDRSAHDLLAQVMLDLGLPLSYAISETTVAGKQVFQVAQNSLYACFDSGITEEFAKAIAPEKPLRLVFKDSSFKDDTAKTNVHQLLKQLSPETEVKVV
jgi:adenine-specific DNA-methyltransferase